MRILVDTNVFLDLFLDREVFADEADAFFSWCAKNKNEIYITSISLRDIGYITHRFFHDKKAARATQFAAYEACKKVIGISSDSAIESLYSDADDYEDSLIIEAAKEELVDAIVTNNKKDFEKSDFPVFTPKEIVKCY